VTIRQRKGDRYPAANLEAARIIAADPLKYPPGSLLGIWAKRVLDGGVSIRGELAARALAETAEGSGMSSEGAGLVPGATEVNMTAILVVAILAILTEPPSRLFAHEAEPLWRSRREVEREPEARQ
jgi:hypothetical protein